MFATHYMEYVSETVAGTTFRHRRRLLLHSIQGYQKLLKVRACLCVFDRRDTECYVRQHLITVAE